MATQTTALKAGHPPRPILDAFYLPRGLLGRAGGVLMARGLPQQREIANLLKAPGTDLCDLGGGPGILTALLAEQHPQLRLHLVDPSPVMRSQAARRCRQWQRAGRVDISAGTADRIPRPDESCDTVVAVNSVVMGPTWPLACARSDGCSARADASSSPGTQRPLRHVPHGGSRSPTAVSARWATRYAPASATSRGMISLTP